MSRILIAGCGDIGSALGLRLHADGHEVWGLRRSPRKLPAGINSLQADLTVPRTLQALPAGLDTAIYIATPDAYDDGAYEAAYVRGAQNLIAALQARGASIARLIFVSSTSVYAQSNGEWVDEESAADAQSFSARRLLQGEGVVLALGSPALVVRFGGIYGAGRNRLIERVRNGRPCQESPPLFTNRIHRDDCVAVLRHLLSLREPRPVYLAVDNEPAPQCAVMDWLAARLGVPAPPRLAAGADADERRSSSKRCRNDLLLASGYRFLYPSYRDGYAAILDDSGRRG